MSGAEAGHHVSAVVPVAPVEQSLYGFTADAGDPAMLMDALEKAFDYRGDVTLRLRDGVSVAGYIFDRVKGKSLSDSYVRILVAVDHAKVKVTFDTIARVEFTGKDAAHGKSFETWVKKYVEKKSKGEKASIESEQL